MAPTLSLIHRPTLCEHRYPGFQMSTIWLLHACRTDCIVSEQLLFISDALDRLRNQLCPSASVFVTRCVVERLRRQFFGDFLTKFCMWLGIVVRFTTAVFWAKPEVDIRFWRCALDRFEFDGIRLCLFLTRLFKVIWEQAASPLLVAAQTHSRVAAHNHLTAFARWRQCSHAHLIHDTSSPPHSQSETVARSVQPFMQVVLSILLICYSVALFPSNLFLSVGDLVSDIVPWTHLTHHTKRHLRRFGRFSKLHGRYKRTDRQNDDRSRPVEA